MPCFEISALSAYRAIATFCQSAVQPPCVLTADHADIRAIRVIRGQIPSFAPLRETNPSQSFYRGFHGSRGFPVSGFSAQVSSLRSQVSVYSSPVAHLPLRSSLATRPRRFLGTCDLVLVTWPFAAGLASAKPVHSCLNSVATSDSFTPPWCGPIRRRPSHGWQHPVGEQSN
jgi:hypothetical protein